MQTSSPLRVLIVDDEPLIRWSLSEALLHEGHAVTEAGDAKETLRRLSADPAPDVIVLDYRLPDSHDLTLLETVRRVAPATAVIMMTAFGTPECASGAAGLGVYRVVNKPFELCDMVSMVPDAFASHAR